MSEAPRADPPDYDRECPVCVFTGMNVSAAKLRGYTCHVCGRDLADHPVEESRLVPLDKAYAMDKGRISVEADFGG